MKKSLFACLTFALVFAGCSSSYKMSTSTRVDLARTVRYIPSLANVSVQPQRVSANATVTEMGSLNGDQQKEFVVAKALQAANADVLIAPQFSTDRGADGKMTAINVSGYPATFTSFRPLSKADAPFAKQKESTQDRVTSRIAVNNLTVVEVEYGTKKTITLAPEELIGKNEASALKYAKEKLLRQEKADFLFEVHYTADVVTGFFKTTVNSFTMTAFPAKYVNYRATTHDEVAAVDPGTKPVVYYNTTADIVPVGQRVQLKFGTGSATARESELKETARAAALKKYNADFLLNETFYFDYQDKVITHVTICGTPAVYANFRPLQKGDVLDMKLISGDGILGIGGDVLGSIKNLFKKK